jgi:hypothetical protein
MVQFVAFSLFIGLAVGHFGLKAVTVDGTTQVIRFCGKMSSNSILLVIHPSIVGSTNCWALVSDELNGLTMYLICQCRPFLILYLQALPVSGNDPLKTCANASKAKKTPRRQL